MRQVATDVWAKPISLSIRSAYIGSYGTIFTIAIYYYSAQKLMLILPSQGGQKAALT